MGEYGMEGRRRLIDQEAFQQREAYVNEEEKELETATEKAKLDEKYKTKIAAIDNQADIRKEIEKLTMNAELKKLQKTEEYEQKKNMILAGISEAGTCTTIHVYECKDPSKNYLCLKNEGAEKLLKKGVVNYDVYNEKKKKVP